MKDEMEDVGLISGRRKRDGGLELDLPPSNSKRMMKEVANNININKSSCEYQRLSWDALRESINGVVNKVSATNIQDIMLELFTNHNLVRGRGLFCGAVIESQIASPDSTDVFAALVSVVNTTFPEIGNLVLRRIVSQLTRAYKRNHRPQLLAAVKFIAHLVNQHVAHELLALQLLALLLDQPTDDSVQVAVSFVTECGATLSPKGLHCIFECFGAILHQGEIEKRAQLLIEGLFVIRNAQFHGLPAIRPELCLVMPKNQLTHHEISITFTAKEDVDQEICVDVFRPDPDYLENEKRYEQLKISILGDETDDDDDDGSAHEEASSDEEDMDMNPQTDASLVNLRRRIHSVIMSCVDSKEAALKLLQIKLEPGQQMELCVMLVECCSQERTYLQYYGDVSLRLCTVSGVHQENFEKCFVQQYSSMRHRRKTERLGRVASFFAHLLATGRLRWDVLTCIRLTEEDTTPASRVLIKILFQELSERLGPRGLKERLDHPAMQEMMKSSVLPKDSPRNTSFAIHFFASIGLGGITQSLRGYYLNQNMPTTLLQMRPTPARDGSESSSGSELVGRE